jgi:hypothetical protein
VSRCGFEESAGPLDGTDDGCGLHGLNAVKGTEVVGDVVIKVGVVAAADGQQQVGGPGCNGGHRNRGMRCGCGCHVFEPARGDSRYTGYDYRRAGRYLEVNFGNRSRVTVVTPEQVGSVLPGSAAPTEPSLVGLTVLVADLDRVSDLLAGNGIPFRSAGGKLVIAAEDACGCAVRFEA